MNVAQQNVDWSLLKIFMVLAQARSFKQASALLGVAHTTISRQIGALENQLGGRLLIRGVSGVSLTPDGERILSHIKQISAHVDELLGDLALSRSQLAGRVRLNTTEGLGGFWLVPELERFALEHAGLEIICELTNVRWQKFREECDIQVRWDLPTEQSVMCKRLGGVRYSYLTTHVYAERHGLPETIADLAKHATIHMRGYEINTSGKFTSYLNTLSKYPPKMVIRNSLSTIPLLRSNEYIAFLPSYSIGYLKENLVEAPLDIGVTADIFVCWDESIHSNTTHRAVISEIDRLFAQQRGKWLLP